MTVVVFADPDGYDYYLEVLDEYVKKTSAHKDLRTTWQMAIGVEGDLRKWEDELEWYNETYYGVP